MKQKREKARCVHDTRMSVCVRASTPVSCSAFAQIQKGSSLQDPTNVHEKRKIKNTSRTDLSLPQMASIQTQAAPTAALPLPPAQLQPTASQRPLMPLPPGQPPGPPPGQPGGQDRLGQVQLFCARHSGLLCQTTAGSGSSRQTRLLHRVNIGQRVLLTKSGLELVTCQSFICKERASSSIHSIFWHCVLCQYWPVRT